MDEQLMRDHVAKGVLAATHSVFQTMLGLEVSPRDPYCSAQPACPGEGVVSLVGLAGQWVGSGSLSLSAALACQISSALLMSHHEAVDAEVLDAVAEVTNMIIGNVKTTLEEEVGPMALSIPTVIFGRNFATRCAGGSEWFVFPFQCGAHVFQVQVYLAQRKEGSPRVGFVNPLMTVDA